MDDEIPLLEIPEIGYGEHCILDGGLGDLLSLQLDISHNHTNHLQQRDLFDVFGQTIDDVFSQKLVGCSVVDVVQEKIGLHSFQLDRITGEVDK